MCSLVSLVLLARWVLTSLFCKWEERALPGLRSVVTHLPVNFPCAQLTPRSRLRRPDSGIAPRTGTQTVLPRGAGAPARARARARAPARARARARADAHAAVDAAAARAVRAVRYQRRGARYLHQSPPRLP